MKRPSVWKTLLFLLIGLLASALVLIVVFFVLVASGSRFGEEFSPDNFASRQFTECRLPWINYQWQPLTHEDTTSEAADYLLTNNLLPAPNNTEQTWQLVSSGGFSEGTDIQLLSQLLEETDENGGSFWINWSEKHPKKAKILWANVAELARDYLYYATPGLTEIARDNEYSLNRFESQVNQYMAQVYYENGELLFSKDETELALERLGKSIAFLPTSKAYQSRANIYDYLGKDDEMAKDLLKIRRLEDNK